MGWLERIGFLGPRKLRRELGKLRSEIGAVTAERDAYLRQRDVALGERNEFLRQRDIAIGERNELLRQRDIALAERNALRHLRETNPEASSLRPERREGSPGLTFLANRFGSDKGDAVGNAHDYTALYSFLLEAWRNDEFQMLELGLQRAAGAPTAYLDPKRQVSDVPSVRMWLEFFPRAHCYGFDCADFTGISVPRFTFIRGDVGNRRDLDRAREHPPAAAADCR